MKNQNTKLKIFIYILLFSITYIILLLLLVHLEQKAENSSIINFSTAVWYSIVTLTTVGYGDMYPVSTFGKIIGYVFVISSLGVLGILIGSLNSLFTGMREDKYLGYKGTNFKNHVVIVGWNQFAGSIVHQLVNANIKVAIITKNRNDIELIKEKYNKNLVYILLSEYDNFELIKKSNIENCYSILLNTDSENDTEKLVHLINYSKLFKNPYYVIVSNNYELSDTFKEAGASFIISRDKISAKIVASYIFEPDVAEYTEDLLSSAKDKSEFDIQEFCVATNNPYINQDFNTVFFNIKKDFNVILIGIAKIETSGKRKLIKNPEGNVIIESGDHLIFILDDNSSKKIEKSFNVSKGSVMHL
ncbi:MAG: hypothetical protein B6I31_02360 [Desulfobacteraceae bacterium 4572_19]|nr:MAG: hypothetical protein B6I31_02360 [Desulfobacteraceae bacterium 4572_19]